MHRKDPNRNTYISYESRPRKGVDVWWYSFYAQNEKTNQTSPFFISYILFNYNANTNEIICKSSKNKTKPSYVMIQVGKIDSQKKILHQIFPINQLTRNMFNLERKIGEHISFSEGLLKGKITNVSNAQSESPFPSSNGSCDWEIHVNKNMSFNLGFITSYLFEKLNFNIFDMLWHAEGIKSYFEGYINFQDERYIISPHTSYGYCDKHWGRRFPLEWIWSTSWNLKSKITKQQLKNSALIVGGGKFRFPILQKRKRRLIVSFYHENRNIEFSFLKFWGYKKLNYKAEIINDEYHLDIHGKNKELRVHIDIYAKINQFIKIDYQSPLNCNEIYSVFHSGNGYGTIKLYDKQNRILDDIEIVTAHCATTINKGHQP